MARCDCMCKEEVGRLRDEVVALREQVRELMGARVDSSKKSRQPMVPQGARGSDQARDGVVVVGGG